jgi:hypothetical protein
MVAAIVGLGLLPALPAAADPGLPAVTFTGEDWSVHGASRQRAWVDAVARHDGERGLSLWSSGVPSYVEWGTDVVPQGHAYASVRAWVFLRHRGAGESVDLLSVTNTQGSAHFDVFVNGRNGRLQWDLFRTDTDSTSDVMAYNRWYLIEAQVEFSGTVHTAQVRIDGVDQGTIGSSGSDSRVRTLHVGSTQAKTHGQYYDDIVLRVGDGPLDWVPAPV